MHARILGASRLAANAIIRDESQPETSCHLGEPAIFPARDRRVRRDDLPTWSRTAGPKSANEVAQIINKRTIR